MGARCTCPASCCIFFLLLLTHCPRLQVVIATRETQWRALMQAGQDVEQQRATNRPDARFGIMQPFIPVRYSFLGQKAEMPTARLSEPQLEKALRGKFGVTRVAPRQSRPHWQGWSSCSWSPRPSSATPAPQMSADRHQDRASATRGLRRRLPIASSELEQVLAKSLVSARMRTRAVVLVATVLSVTILVGTFVSGIVDIFVTALRRNIANPAPAQLHYSDDGWALRTYFYVFFTEIVRNSPAATCYRLNRASWLVARRDACGLATFLLADSLFCCVSRRVDAPSGFRCNLTPWTAGALSL